MVLRSPKSNQITKRDRPINQLVKSATVRSDRMMLISKGAIQRRNQNSIYRSKIFALAFKITWIVPTTSDILLENSFYLWWKKCDRFII
jgi:hypothetical protein